MITPIRVRSDSPITLVGGVRPALEPDHPLAVHPCPVCDGPLTDAPVTLVLVGIAPSYRKPDGGWTTGAAVPVHAHCAGAGQ
jgi:hypothetical protein